MSVTLAQKYDQESYECNHCDGERDPRNGWGSYCSRECYLLGEGERILEHVTRDHRWCASCWRQCKTVNTPSKRLYTDPPDHPGRWQWKDLAIGYQYPTKNMVWTEGTGYDERGPLEVTFSTWGCRCGASDLGTRDEDLQDIETDGLANRVYHCLQSFHREGQWDQSPDPEALDAAMDERPGEWAWIVGRAMFSDE